MPLSVTFLVSVHKHMFAVKPHFRACIERFLRHSTKVSNFRQLSSRMAEIKEDVDGDLDFISKIAKGRRDGWKICDGIQLQQETCSNPI